MDVSCGTQNGKDQTMELWDLRMVMSPRDFRSTDPNYPEARSDYGINRPSPSTGSRNPSRALLKGMEVIMSNVMLMLLQS